MSEHDREAERIRGLMTSVAPAGPDPRGRADAVMKRGRRNRKRALAVGAAGLAVAAIAVLPSLVNDDGATRDPSAAEGPTTGVMTGPLDPLEVAPCPDEPIDLAVADQKDPPTLTPGAVAIRMCLATFSGWHGPTLLPPADALVHSVDEFYADLDHYLAPEDPQRCATVRPLPDPYVLNLVFADGAVKPLLVSSSCTDIIVGDRLAGSGDVVQAFLDKLSAQRSWVEPAADPPTPDCSDPLRTQVTRSPNPKELALVMGDFCRWPDGVNAPPDVQLLSADLLAEINAEWRSNAVPQYGVGGSQPMHEWASPVVWGTNAWGDRIDLAYQGDGKWSWNGYLVEFSKEVNARLVP